MSEQPITSLEDAVAALGALPMPVGVEPVRDVEDELTGARLALFEEEQETAALREERHSTNEALDDAIRALRTAQERIAVLEAREEIVSRFVEKRAEYITAIRNCHPDNGHDYDRWQGHAAARRQLAQELGLPVAWPVEDSAAVEKSAAKLARVLAPSEGEHYATVHHAYTTSHDLEWPEPGDQR
jgi:hypothetical protein